MLSEWIVLRLDTKESQTIHTNIITDKNEIKDPREDTIFHGVKASG